MKREPRVKKEGDDLPELEPLSPSKKPRRSSVRIATMKSVSFQRNQSTETKHEAKHETKLEGVKTIKSENKLKQEEVVVSREKGVKKEESTGKKRSRGAIKPEAKEEKHKAKVSKKAKKVVQSTDPYPNHLYPLPSHCAKAVKGLQSLHGKITRHPPRPVLDSLIGTILSQNTTDDTSARAFANLKRRFPAWEEVRLAKEEEVEEQIRCCGLSVIRAERIKAILQQVYKEREGKKPRLSMEYVREIVSNQQVKDELVRFKGVGPKTAACVLMFNLQRAEFPVDTHVWRICKNLGWVPKTCSREQCYEHMNRRVPDDLKYDLHCLLVNHGKRCVNCAKNNRPRKEVVGPCPLKNVKT